MTYLVLSHDLLSLSSAANKCFIKVAMMTSNLEMFEKASGIFEEVQSGGGG